MGTVYLAARQRPSGLRLYAVKMLHAYLAEDEEHLHMFLDEARLASLVHHENLVEVREIGMHGDVPFVVMEYVEGTALSTLLRCRPGGLPAGLVVRIVLDLLRGLHAAHSAYDSRGEPLNMVHRDVAPANVLVSVQGCAKLTDFGIAKAEARLTATRSGVRKGRLDFMSPEQMLSPEQIDRRSDIFAVGTLLWSALAGRRLFRGPHDAATIERVLELPVPPISQVRRDQGPAPAALEPILERALQRDVEARYATAREMADELEGTARAAGCLATREELAEFVRETVDAERAKQGRLDAGRTEPTHRSGPVDSTPTARVGPEGVGEAPAAPRRQGLRRFAQALRLSDPLVWGLVALSVLFLLAAFGSFLSIR